MSCCKNKFFKAILIRIIFSIHSLLGVYLVVYIKRDWFFWYLYSPVSLLFYEGIITLTLRKTREWSWFCPSVFLYLSSIVPAIWLLELDKVDRRMKAKEELPLNLTTTGVQLKELNNFIGVDIKLPEIPLSTETWITLIEQFLMLILIIGRWMLPKGDLTRDQLSQLLLVYIGTAADIIEFFDSFKDDKIAAEPILVLLTLSIWSWSLMQFTVVLTATKSRKSRLTSTGSTIKKSESCCTIDVWGIALNITLQDAPFLVFRLLLITHFKIISYMNVFFTCKNTLVILLQLYRLYVVHSEHNKNEREDFELTNISIISKGDMYGKKKGRKKDGKGRRNRSSRRSAESQESSEADSADEIYIKKKTKNSRKDTGYSTGSSHTSTKNHIRKSHTAKLRESAKSRAGSMDRLSNESKKQKLKRSDRETKGRRKLEEALSEESHSEEYEEPKKREKSRSREERKYEKEPTLSVSTTDPSSE